MNKRRLKKALKRIYYLPRNKHLFKYLYNKGLTVYLRLIKSTRTAYPSTLMLELTNHCNIACTICPREHQYGKEMDKGRMDTALAKKIIDEAYPYLDSIGLTGLGETFMYKEIGEIVDYIKSKNKGIIISVSTNAVLPHFIERVTPVIGKIDTIQISIDGLNKVYNQIRVKSDFNLLDQNVRILTKLCKHTDTELMLNMVVTKENYTHMPHLVHYAAEVGIPYLDFTLFNLAAVTELPASYYAFYQSEAFLAVVQQLDEAMAKNPTVTITHKNFQTENSFQKCGYPWNHFYVSQDGYLPPCCAKPFPKLKSFGSLNHDRLIDVLNSSEIQEWRSLWYQDITPEFCQKCHLVNIPPIKQEEKRAVVSS